MNRIFLLYLILNTLHSFGQEIDSSKTKVSHEDSLFEKLFAIINNAPTCFSNLKGDSLNAGEDFMQYSTKTTLYGQTGVITEFDRRCQLDFNFDKGVLTSNDQAKLVFNEMRNILKKFSKKLYLERTLISNKPSEINTRFDEVFRGWNRNEKWGKAAFEFQISINHDKKYFFIEMRFVHNISDIKSI